MIVVAALRWGMGSFVSPRLSMPSDPLVSTGWQMLVGGARADDAALASGELGDVHWRRVLGEVAVVRSPTSCSSARSSPTAPTRGCCRTRRSPRSSTYAYVNPVVAVVLGWAVLGETFGPMMLAGEAIIVGSVAVTVRSTARGAPTATVPAETAETSEAQPSAAAASASAGSR